MKIKSLQEYLTLIERLNSNCTYRDGNAVEVDLGDSVEYNPNLYTPHFLYRGHSDGKSYLLTPGIFRYKNTDNKFFSSPYTTSEGQILRDFISEGCRFIKDIPTNDVVSWVEIAQHFGAPTRLLDFSENPLIALYMACTNALGGVSSESDGSVWLVNEPAYNKKFHFDDSLKAQPPRQIVHKIMEQVLKEETCGIENPYIYKPYYQEERMSSQSSIFMVWGDEKAPLTEMIQEQEYIVDKSFNQHDKILCHIEIPKARKEKLLRQLDLCGINQKFIYPGLEGVGKYFKAKYSKEVHGELTPAEFRRKLQKELKI